MFRFVNCVDVLDRKRSWPVNMTVNEQLTFTQATGTFHFTYIGNPPSLAIPSYSNKGVRPDNTLKRYFQTCQLEDGLGGPPFTTLFFGGIQGVVSGRSRGTPVPPPCSISCPNGSSPDLVNQARLGSRSSLRSFEG